MRSLRKKGQRERERESDNVKKKKEEGKEEVERDEQSKGLGPRRLSEARGEAPNTTATSAVPVHWAAPLSTVTFLLWFFSPTWHWQRVSKDT